MSRIYFQDVWPDELSNCYGCGRNNKEGLQIKSYWENDESICIWTPKKHLMAGKDILCGGVVATLIDCHCLNTAIATAYKISNRELGTNPFLPYATGEFQMKLIKPIPLKKSITLKAKVEKISENKMIVSCSLFSDDRICAKGHITAIKVSDNFWKKE